MPTHGKGVTSGQLLPQNRRHFPGRRTEVINAVVVDINMKSWTVSCCSKLDSRFWADIQNGSLYLHQNQGEGVYCMPEVGATCMVCIPSDTTGPFVLAYVSPGQTTVRGQEVDATGSALPPEKTGMTDEQAYKEGVATLNDSAKKTDYSYGSNRPVAKPGDIVMRGRDGNFCILHRGGVLQIGASTLAQRIYVPLTNLVTDISERYEHQNVGGTIQWGMQPLQYVERETWWRQCFRVYADDRYCDCRLTVGKVRDPIKLPDGDDDIADNPMDPAQPVTYEFVMAPASDSSGFKGVDGETTGDAHNNMTMLFRMDRSGNCHVRFKGNALMTFRHNLLWKVKGDLRIQAKTINFETTSGGDAKFGSPAGATSIEGQSVKVAGGGAGVARLMDTVIIPGDQLLFALMQILAPTAVAGAPLIANPAAAAEVSLYGSILTASTKTETG